MTDRGWEELVDQLDQKFGLSNHQRRREPLPDRPELHRDVEQLEFEKGGHHFRVERVVGPAVIDKKTFYHKVGTSEHTQYVYDPTETSSQVHFYRAGSAGEWTEIQPEALLS